jgi:hypothetical protein
MDFVLVQSSAVVLLIWSLKDFERGSSPGAARRAINDAIPAIRDLLIDSDQMAFNIESVLGHGTPGSHGMDGMADATNDAH